MQAHKIKEAGQSKSDNKFQSTIWRVHTVPLKSSLSEDIWVPCWVVGADWFTSAWNNPDLIY